MNRHATYLGERSFHSEVIVRTRRHTDRQIDSHTVPSALLGPLKWSVTKQKHLTSNPKNRIASTLKKWT